MQMIQGCKKCFEKCNHKNSSKLSNFCNVNFDVCSIFFPMGKHQFSRFVKVPSRVTAIRQSLFLISCKVSNNN